MKIFFGYNFYLNQSMGEFLHKNRQGAHNNKNHHQAQQTQRKVIENNTSEKSETKSEEDLSKDSPSAEVFQRKWDSSESGGEDRNQSKGPVPSMAEQDEEQVQSAGPVPLQFYANETEEEPVQRRGPVPPMSQESEGVRETGNERASDKLPAMVQTKMETSFGADFSDVSIHKNSSQSKDLGAHAYTQGNNIHFAPGQYNPESEKGQELLGHELTHVVQQREGRVNANTQAFGVNINNETSLETEADVMGSKAARGVIQNKPANAGRSNGDNMTVQAKMEELLDFQKLAEQIYNAIDGLGTDEEAVFNCLLKLHHEKVSIDRLKQAYKSKYGEDLVAALNGDLSGDELKYALNLLVPKAAATKEPDFDAIAKEINGAVSGMGTNEDTVYTALGKLEQNPAYFGKLKSAYKALYNVDLKTALLDDFSGAELDHVLKLIGEVSGKDKELEECRKIIARIEKEYGINVNSQAGIDAIKSQYTNVPAAELDKLKTQIWEYKELVALEKALSHFTKILGPQRAGSSRNGQAQEITSVSKVDQAIDSNSATGTLDNTTLGEYFVGSTNFSMFRAGTNSTVDFSDNNKQLEGTAVHEIAHGLVKYALPSFLTATGYWLDERTPNGGASDEAPITDYGTTNAAEDFSESVMYYFVEPDTLKNGKSGIATGTVGNPCPKRFNFIKNLISNW